MKNPSIFRTALLAIFGAFAVAGVMVFALLVGGKSSATLGPVTIWGTLPESAFDVVLRQANESGGQLGQVTYVQKDAATYEQAITNALANGEGPDLFLLRQDQVVGNVGKVYIIPFAQYPKASFESTFIDAAKPFYTNDGVAAIPLFADPLVLYWNKDILATAGYAQPPQYWDQLLSMTQKIAVKDETGTIRRAAIAMGEYQNVTNAKDILATLILQAGGPITMRSSDGTLSSALMPRDGSSDQSAVTALRFYTEFADPSKEIYTWNRSLAESQRAFASGDLALYIGYASEEPMIRKSNANLNYAIAALPQIRSNPTTIDTAHVYGIAISRTGKNISNAQTAAMLLSQTDTLDAISQQLGIPSARRDLLSRPGTGNADLFNKSVIIAHSWYDPDPEGTAQIFRAMIENTTSGSALINDAVQRADQELGHLLSI